MTASQLSARVRSYWLTVDDAAPLVLVRLAYGLAVAAWGVSLIPDFGRIFGADGLNRTIHWAEWNRLSIFRYVDNEVVLGVALAALIVGGLVIAAGRGLRIVFPLVVIVQISLADYAGPWTIGAEVVLRVLGIYLALFAMVTPSAFQGRMPGPGRAAGIAPVWPLRLLQIQIALIYFVTASEKSRGSEWWEGSAVYHALEIEHLRRLGAPGFVTDIELVVKLATWGTLAVEFALPALLLWPRTRRWAVLLAIGLHVSFEFFLELGFFGPAMIIGILAFTAPADANRLLTWRPRTRRTI